MTVTVQGTPRQGPLRQRPTRGPSHGVDQSKPHLRGWLHAIMVPVTLAAGIVLVALSPTATDKAASAVFCSSAVLLFAVSAAYHTRTWNDRARVLLRRFDHANIFLLIAGSYTPYAVLLLTAQSAWTLLAVVWTGAALGVAFRFLWVTAPRWLYVPIYVGLGWAAVAWAGEFSGGTSPAELTLVVTGGVLYTLGGIVYGTRRPNPAPRWFGFHEVFHGLTIAAFVAHYAGVALILTN